MNLLRSKLFWVTAILVTFVGLIVSCTKSDSIIGGTAPTTNETDLLSLKTSSAPGIDGTIDPMWDNASKLEFTAQVPEPGNNLFSGYIGETFNGTIRSMYDDANIYFLVEITDNDKNIKSTPWYFNPSANVSGKTGWAQELNARAYNTNGQLTREGWGEDKFAMLWNIDNSTPKFVTQQCYASCHVFTPYFNYYTNVYTSNAASGNHYTNGTDEKIDMWWLHPNRGFAFGKLDDEYQDWAGGPAVTNITGGNANGRHFDDQVVDSISKLWPNRPVYSLDATQGSVNNRQTLKLDGNGASVTVPWWIIPNGTSDFLKASDTLAGGVAKKVTAVSSAGVLTYDGGTIDPNTGTDYQRIGDAVYGTIGPKCFPGVIVSPVLRGRADIDLSAVYTGGGWIYEFKRPLKTADALKQDINFTSLTDQPFGVAYWDRSNYQHGIKPGLVLKFQK